MSLNNEMKNSARKRPPTLWKESFLNKVGDAISGFFYRKADRSLLARIFTKYEGLDELKKNSFFAFLAGAITGWLASVCRKFTQQLETSLTLRLVERLKTILLTMSIRVWGATFIAYAASMAGLIAARRLLQSGEVLLDSVLIASIAVFALGIAMLSSRQPLWDALTGSLIFKQLLVKYAGIRPIAAPAKATPVNAAFPIAAGLVLGAVSAFVNPILAPAALVLLVGFALVMTNTEFGVLLLLFALPFGQTMQLAAFCLLILFSFLVKLIRGKRRIRFERLDLAVLAFSAFLFFFGGLFSLSPASSLPQIALYLLFILTYFVTANTIRSRQWADKAIWTILTAGALSALVGVYQYFGGFDEGLIWVDTEMFSDISGRIIGTFENPNVFGEFLILLIPAAVAMFLIRGGLKKYYALCILGALGAALIFTFSRGAWLAIILALGIFLLLQSRSFFKFCLIGVFAVPFLPIILPDSIVQRFLSIGNMTDSSTAYRVYIWIASLRLIERFWPSGIGSGVNVFMQVYPKYALSGVAMAPHAHNLFLVILVELGITGFIAFLAVIIYLMKLVLSAKDRFTDKPTATIITALGTGILAFLLQGLTDNVWYNYRIVLMFWLLMGVTVAYSRSYRLEWGGERPEY